MNPCVLSYTLEAVGFLGGTVVKKLPANAGDGWVAGLIPGVRKIPWGRKWQSTPVFLPGEPRGRGRLAGYSLWGHKGVRHNRVYTHTLTLTHTHSLSFSLSIGNIEELNGNLRLKRELLETRVGPGEPFLSTGPATPSQASSFLHILWHSEQGPRH